MTTLASIARDENFLHLTVTPTPVEAPEGYFPEDRRYYRYDVVMTRQGVHPSLDAYMKLMNYLNDGFDYPLISSMPLSEDAGVEVDREHQWAESIYIEDKDERPCPAFIEDGSCIHSEHTK